MTDTQLALAARICHLAWVAYCMGNGQPYNAEATDAQRASQIDGLKAYLANPGMTPEQNHENWMRYKFSQGWVYGVVKDETAKTHPDLVPYAMLPEAERMKDEMDLLARAVAVQVVGQGAG